MKFAVKGLALLALCMGFSQSVASAHDWTGGYVGLNIGVNAAQGKASTSPVAGGYFNSTSVPAITATGNQTLSKTGINFGGQGGYNWNIGGNWLLGVEADIGLNSDTARKSATGTYPCCAPTGYTVTSNVSTNWLFTARPKIAYAWDDWMAYATGGLAMANEKASFLFTDTYATAHESGTYTGTNAGWTVGGGVENALSDSWSWNLEYLYADLGGVGGTSTNLTAYSPVTAYPTSVFTHHGSLTEHLVRFGINYHL